MYFVAFAFTAAGLIAPAIGLVGGLVLAAAAYLGLPLAVDMRIRGRRDKIVGQLPMVLDLLTLSIEAGMSFDAALQRLVRRLDGPLVDELTLMLRDQLGTSRPCPDPAGAAGRRVRVTSFARATQADRLGVPLAQMLRTQADELRVRLRNEAGEHAMKAIKMLFRPPADLSVDLPGGAGAGHDELWTSSGN